jgi:hypothetical protein
VTREAIVQQRSYGRLPNDDNFTYKQRTYQEVTTIIRPIAEAKTYEDNPDVL